MAKKPLTFKIYKEGFMDIKMNTQRVSLPFLFETAGIPLCSFPEGATQLEVMSHEIVPELFLSSCYLPAEVKGDGGGGKGNCRAGGFSTPF